MPKSIVLCELHLDSVARELVLNNLSFLTALGYHCFGFEHDHDKSLAFEIACLKRHCESMDSIAVKLSQFLDPLGQIDRRMDTSNRVLLDLLCAISETRGAMAYAGLDIALGDRFSMSRQELIGKVTEKMAERDAMITDRLLAIREQGAISIIGAGHMAGVQANLIARLGFKAAQSEFLFIVPFSELFQPESDIRRQMIDWAIADSAAFESSYPLGAIFYNKYPERSAWPRFQQIVLNQGFVPSLGVGDEEDEDGCCLTACCGRIARYLPSFFQRPVLVSAPEVPDDGLSFKKHN